MPGPSFSGPLTRGWTSASLVPQAATVAALPPPVITPPQQTAASTPDLASYRLSESDFGTGGEYPTVQPQPTPLESLLAALFPDAAMGGAEGDSPINTILGNLNARRTASTAAPTSGSISVFTGPPAANVSIPGAPAAITNAIGNLQSGFVAPTVPGPNTNPLDSLGGVSAIAAEQRIQQAEQAKAKADASAKWAKSQQKLQQDAAKRQQIQRQKFGFTPSGVSSPGGWTSPSFY